jgi:hypothetical protein
MAKLAEIQRAYENAQRAGNAEDAQALAQILQRASRPQEPRVSTFDQIQQQAEELSQVPRYRPREESGFLGNIASGFGAGAVNVGELAALGAASLLEEEEELAARKKIQDFASGVRPEGGDPDSIAYKLASGLGSIAGIAAPAVAAAFAPVSAPVAAGIGLGGAATLGIGAGAGEASERARAAGATEEERAAATLRGAAIGSLEVTPLTRIFRRLPKIGQLFGGGGEEVAGLVGRLRSAAKTGAAEGAQEAAAGILQNLNERGYNVGRELVDAGVLEEGAIGAGSGAILQGIVDLFTRGKPRGAPVTEEPPATEEEVVEEQQLLGLPAPDPDKLVQVRMPDGSVQEVRQSNIEAARRREQEAVQAEERRQTELSAQMDAIQRVEREDAQQREREQGVDLPESEVRAAEEQRARARAQDEQIDAFTLEREIESAQPRREAPKPEPTEQMDLPIEQAERDQVQREMFGPRGGIPRRAKEQPTTQPPRIPEQQDMGFEQQQEQQALIGPKGGIPRRRKEPFKQPALKAKEPAPSPDILTDARLNDLGIAPKSPARKALVGKDINQPAIRQRLQNFVESPRLGSQQARANVARLLEGVSERQGDLFTPTTQRRGPTPETRVRDAGVAEPQQVPSGVSVPTAVPDVGAERAVPPAQPDTTVPVAPKGTGVADTGRGVREPVRGAVVEQPALETPTGTKPGEKTTTPKQVTQKAKTTAAPAKEERKSRTTKGVVKRGVLSRPKLFEVPADKDPVLDADIDAVEARLAETVSRDESRSKSDERSALEAYFGRDERVIDALDRAIHDVVDKSARFTTQKGVSEETKAYFAQSGRENAKQVLAWAKKNLSKETNAWIEKRLETKKKALRRVTKRTKEVLAAEVKEAERPSELKAQSKKTTQRVIRDYVDDAAYAKKEASREQRELDAEIKAIEEFFDELPYELRTGDVVLGNELHPVTTSLLREGKLGEALRVLASLTPENRVRQLANKLADNVGNTKVEFFFDTKEGSLAGAFDPQTNTIKLNEAYDISQHTLLHEMVHAAASATLAKPSHPLTKQLNKLFEEVKDSLGTAYGATNLDEFVSEAMSNPQFQAELAGINPDGSNINALQRFINSVGNFLRRLIGLNNKQIDTAQTKVDSLIDEILAPAPEFRDANVLAMESTASGVKQMMGAMGKVQKTVSKPFTKKGREEFAQEADSLIDTLGNNNSWLIGKLVDLQALGDIAKRVDPKLGTIAEKFLDTVERLRGAMAKGDTFVRGRVTEVEKWYKSATVEQREAMDNLIYSREHGATIYQVDPTLSKAEAKKRYSEPVDGNDLFAVWEKQRNDWRKIGPEGHAAYKTMRDTYKDLYKQLEKVVTQRIDDTMGANSEGAKSLKKEVLGKLFDSKTLDVYFPLIREGRYKLAFSYKPGKAPSEQDQYVFQMFQSKAEWRREIERLKNDPDVDTDSIESGEGDFELKDFSNAPSASFIGQTFQLLKAAKVDADTQEAFMRLYVSTLPETSFAKSLQRRRNTAGHERDALYAIKSKGFDLARQVAKLEYGAQIQQLEADMNELKGPKTGNTKFKMLQNELATRMKFARTGARFKDLEAYVRTANQLAFVGTIGFNVASAMVQTAQIPMFVMPMLGAEHGYKASYDAILNASNIVTGARHGKPKASDSPDYKERVSAAFDAASPAYGLDAYYKVTENGDYVVRDDMGLPASRITELKELAPLVRLAAERGHLNRSYIMDALSLQEGGKVRRTDSLSQKLGSALDFGTGLSAQLFNQAERYNRQVSMVASYKLALDKLKAEQPNLSKAEREAQAAKTAIYQTQEYNGGSTLETAPRIAQENILRVAMMYKTYGLRMYYTMLKSAGQALDVYKAAREKEGISSSVAETMRSTAGKQLLGIHGSALFFSGVHGIPLYGAVQLLADLFVLGEEEDDFNTIVRNHVGEGWYKGAFNQILSEAGVGADVASRIRLTGLLVQENRYNTDPSAEEFIGYYLCGPALSVGKRVGRGFSDLYNGEFQRGVENLLPVGFSNAYKVLGRYQQDEGIYSRRGDPIYDDITGGELAAQFFGFAPSEYTRIQENNQRKKRIDIELSRRASDLRKKYYIATRQGDYSEAREVFQDILEYNRKHPTFRITPDSIRRSMKQHMKTSAEMYNGVTLSPAMRQALRSHSEAERNGFVFSED